MCAPAFSRPLSFDSYNPSLPPNVVGEDGSVPDLGPEHLYYSRLFTELSEQMGAEFWEWNFTIRYYRWHTDRDKVFQEPHRKKGKRNALLLLSDEHERFPIEGTRNFDYVFRQYMSSAEPQGHIHPFPPAYHEASGEADSTPFEKRRFNLFFSGYRNRNRVDFYKQFRPISWLPRWNLPGRYARELARRLVDKFCPEKDFSSRYPASIVQFTEWFGKGLPPEEYADVLSNTRVAVCPPGFISSETIRHWEAMRLGCVILSAPLPENHFYKDSPIIIVKDWSDFHRIYSELINNPQRLTEIHWATCNWWREVCSEGAVASYMAGILGVF